MSRRRPDLRAAASFALAAAVFLVGLGAYGFAEPSDARYAEIAREMQASGDWMHPTLLGIRHYHKPPLIYWLTQPGLRVLGDNPWGARVVQAVLGLALCALLYRFARRHVPQAAPWSVPLLATIPGIIGASHLLTTDLLLAVCVTAALTAWHDVRTGCGGRGSRVLLWASLGCAFLAKGPVGWIVPALVIAAALALDRSGGGGARRAWGAAWGVPLMLAVALPWYLAVAADTPGLAGYFLGAQVAGRLREGGLGHPHPWHYFLLVAPALGVPWLLLAPRGWHLLRVRDPRLADLLAAWALVPPLFFSIPATKLPLYVVPSYSAVALLGAAVLAEPRVAKGSVRAAGALLLALGAGMGLAAAGRIPLRGGDVGPVDPAGMRVLLSAPAMVLVAGGLAALLAARSRPRGAAAAMALALAFVAPWLSLHGRLLPLHTAEGVGRMVAREYRPGDALLLYRRQPDGLPFYSGAAPMPLLVGIPRETGFEPPGRMPPLLDAAAFAALWGGERRVLAVTSKEYLEGLPGAVLIGAAGGYLLCTNRPAHAGPGAPR